MSSLGNVFEGINIPSKNLKKEISQPSIEEKKEILKRLEERLNRNDTNLEVYYDEENEELIFHNKLKCIESFKNDNPLKILTLKLGQREPLDYYSIDNGVNGHVNVWAEITIEGHLKVTFKNGRGNDNAPIQIGGEIIENSHNLIKFDCDDNHYMVRFTKC